MTRIQGLGHPVAGPLLALLVMAGTAATGWAAAPQVLGQLTDQVHALDTCRQDVITAQRSLWEATPAELVVLFVDSTDGVDIADYAAQILSQGPAWRWSRVALLVVATEDRQYRLQLGEQLRASVSVSELDDIISVEIQPRLHVDDWCGAVLGAARGLTEAVRDDVPVDTRGHREYLRDWLRSVLSLFSGPPAP